MAPDRIVVETLPDRRLVREYAADGTLLRILVEPITRGATSDLPPVTPMPRPEPRRKAAAAPPVVAPEAPPVSAKRQRLRLPTAKPAPPAPKAFELLDVEPVEDAPPAAEPPVAEAPPVEPAPVEAAPVEPPREVEPATTPKKRRLSFTLPRRAPKPMPEPKEAAPAPVEPEPAPAAVEPEPEPAPPVKLEVPDLEARVDALFAKRDRPNKARKRAPIPVPEFPPLAREPWEERLDRALEKR